MSSPATTNDTIFIGPGLSLFKRIVTIISVIAVTTLVVWVALHEGLPAIGSTIIALLFILGFVVYLRLVAPVPFTIELEDGAVVKRSKQGESIEVKWEDLTRVKEEFFPNGKRISITVYRKPAPQGQKAKAWAVYRDDINDLDGLAGSLKRRIPTTCQWVSETVHE